MTFPVSRRLASLERTLIRKIFDEAPPDAINLGLGQPDLPTPPAAALAGIRGIAEGRTGYTSTAGDPELRAALAERYRPFASGPGNVAVTIGSQEALVLACLALLDPGDELLVPDPGYPAYPVVAGLLGCRPVAYPLRAQRGFRLDPDDVASRIGERTRAVVLCVPSNPTGACVDRRDLEALCTLLGERGIPWISDEVYAGFVYEGPFVSPSEIAPEGGLVISSLSKDLCMTGWRVGWVVGPETVLERVTAAHQYLVTCAPSVSQRAALGALSDAGRESARAYLERFRRRRQALGDELARIPGLGFERPQGAFYYFVDVSAHGCSLEIARRLLRNRNVVTIPGEAFGANGAGWLRISFAAPEARIREGIRRLGEELARGQV